MKNLKLQLFQIYDIRGRIPDPLNEEIAYRIELLPNT